MIRSAELLCALSLATDLGSGQPLEHGLKVCAAALALAEAAGVEATEDVYCASLLHSIGCTSDAFEAAVRFGDDVAVRAGWATVDGSNPAEVVAFLARYAGAGQPIPRRALAFAAALAAGSAGPRQGFLAHCEVGVRLAERLRLPDAAREALWFVFERWDGKGYPDGAAGEAIPLVARVLHVARDGVIFAADDGADAACAVIRSRAGTVYDPALAATLTPAMIGGTDWDATHAATAASVTWQWLLGHPAAPRAPLSEEALDEALGAVADFADLKSPSTLGHSRRVAELAEAAAWRLDLGGATATALRHAGLVHDLGRAAVSNAIWDKPGPLTELEWERVRMHPYFTERALARSPGLAALATIAAAHHERLGGVGYFKGVNAALLPIAARVLAAADAYSAMTEPRAHRAALSSDRAAAELRAAPLDPEAVEAVLAAAGHRAHPPRRGLPAGLSAREAEVLALVARGHANKAIGLKLGISAKTVGHHVGHVYAKIGVSTRAAAALFAVEHGLIGQTPDDGFATRA